MSQVKMYHNPRCSTSRKVLDLLRENNIEPTLIHYLDTPPSRDEIKRILKMLNIPPRQLMRKKESLYQELNLDHSNYTDEQLIDVLVENPILIERPIVIFNNKALVARPAEKILGVI